MVLPGGEGSLDIVIDTPEISYDDDGDMMVKALEELKM